MTDFVWQAVECKTRYPCNSHHEARVTGEGCSVTISLCSVEREEDEDEDVWLVELHIDHHKGLDIAKTRFPVAYSKFVRDTSGTLDDVKKEGALAYWQIKTVLGWGLP